MAKAPPVIFARRMGIPLPIVAKRGPKEVYPFETLVAPVKVFAIATETDAKGKTKNDKDGNPIYLTNDDGSWKLALDVNGLPIPVMIKDASGADVQAIDYDSFGVKDRSKKQINSTIFTAEQRFIGTPATVKDEKTGKDVANKTREFVAVEVDAATDPDGASIRVFRTK